MLRKKLMAMLGAIVVLSMMMTACATPTPERIVETVVVKETVETVKEVEVEVVKTVEKVVEKTVEVMVTPEAEEGALPRNETLYFNGQQWGAVVGWNPYSSSNNNAMMGTGGDSHRATMFETPYLYNIDGQQIHRWRRPGRTTPITFKSRPPAGDTATAEDSHTRDTHLKYNTGVAGNMSTLMISPPLMTLL